MPRGQLDRWETAAGNLVAELLGGRAEPRDVPGAPPGTVDFAVLLADGRVIALEVTTAADSEAVAEGAVTFGHEWKSADLKNDWMIGIGPCPSGRIQIRPLMAAMMRILALFERLGETSVEVRYSPLYRAKPAAVSSAMYAAMIEMVDLGVETARIWGTAVDGAAGQILPTMSAGVSSNPHKINRLVSGCAERKVEKLIAATADERHLFIWLDSSHSDAELAFSTLAPPGPPAIPSCIDLIWLVAPTGWPDMVRIWRASPPGPWTVLSPPNGHPMAF